MTETPVAVVGAGPWGRTIAAAIAATPGISLAAIVSANPETRRKTDPAPRVCRTWQEAVEKTDTSGIILAVPPMHQPDIAVALIESGIPVMLEKPMAASVSGAEAIRAAAETHGFRGLVNHLHVYAPAFRMLLSKLSNLPGARTVQATAGAHGPYRTGWSPLWDWAGHDLAMVLSVIDGDPIGISARPDADFVENGRRYRNYRIDLTFRDGSRADLHIGNAFDRKNREFRVTADGSALCYRESDTSEISLSIDGVEQPGIGAGTENRPLNAALIAFANRIRSGGGIEDITLGAKIVRLIDAAQRSVQSGDPVLLATAGQS
ncbi:MAG: Gfo/Idh/MocA family protein [Alphaproteobacteria bacterium]